MLNLSVPIVLGGLLFLAAALFFGPNVMLVLLSKVASTRTEWHTAMNRPRERAEELNDLVHQEQIAQQTIRTVQAQAMARKVLERGAALESGDVDAALKLASLALPTTLPAIHGQALNDFISKQKSGEYQPPPNQLQQQQNLIHQAQRARG